MKQITLRNGVTVQIELEIPLVEDEYGSLSLVRLDTATDEKRVCVRERNKTYSRLISWTGMPPLARKTILHRCAGVDMDLAIKTLLAFPDESEMLYYGYGKMLDSEKYNEPAQTQTAAPDEDGGRPETAEAAPGG